MFRLSQSEEKSTAKTNMSKVEVMDKYLESSSKLKGKEVRAIVKDVFGADLNYISEKNYGSKLSIYDVSIMESLRISLNGDSNSTELDAQIMDMPKNEVMNRFIEVNDSSLTGAQIRVLINQIFGVNLDGISGLEHLSISIYSKGLWILQKDTDLFIVSSSLDDVELYVSSTEYFEETTGSNQLPESLKQNLISIGFSYDAELDQFVYRNSTNESVPDAFKGQVVGSVVGIVIEFNKNK